MQTRHTASPQIATDHELPGRSGACAQPSGQAHGTALANPTRPADRIELRRVYRLSLFASGTAEI
jgi:hypothetical protein